MPEYFEIKDNSLEYREKIIQNLGCYVVPILTKVPHTTRNFQTIGSGVIVGKNNRTFLTTARHVANSLIEDRPHVVKIYDKIVKLDQLAFYNSETSDLAIAELFDEWLIAKQLLSINRYDIERSFDNLQATKEMFVMGYPATKNKIEPALEKTKLCLFSLVLKQSDCPNSNTKIVAPLLLEFQRNNLISTERKPYGKPPKLNGISGGGIFELLEEYINEVNGDTVVKQALMLRGIVSECREAENHIVGASVDAVNELINKVIKTNELVLKELGGRFVFKP